MTLPPNMRGWETGTLEVSDVRFTSTNPSLFDAQATRLRVVTSEQVEVLPKKEADVQGHTISWEMDMLRLPVYARYQSSVVFEIGKTGGPLSVVGVGVKPDAIAVLWMQDLTDDIEQEVKLPVLVSDNIENLRQNAINDQTQKHHDFKVVGELVARIKLDSGLDEDHEVCLSPHLIVSIIFPSGTRLMNEFEQNLKQSQSRRHALEAYDHIEGEAEIARKQTHFADDGVIDKHEQKEIDKAHKRQLQSRERGPAQVKAYRSAKWMAKGIKERLPGNKPKTRERQFNFFCHLFGCRANVHV